MEVILQVLVILLLIVANGIFSMSETAVVSARKALLEHRASEGDTQAAAALALAQAPNVFLATVQVGITLTGILSGALGSATIAEAVREQVSRIQVLAPYSGALSLGIVVVVITYLTLILGELVPKRLALNDPEGIASTIAAPMRALSRVTSPVVQLLAASTEAVLGLMQVRPTRQPAVTEEEIGVLLEQGARAGVFVEAEREMVESVFDFADRRISELMTPRPDVIWLDLEDPPEETRRRLLSTPFSRFPVCRGDLDHVVGVVRAKDLLVDCMDGKPTDIEAVLKKPLIVPENALALNALETFKGLGQDMALVADEYGSIVGVVTLTDILEAIVGEVPTIGQEERPEIVRREDGSWLMDGLVLIDKVREALDLDDPAREDAGTYHTLAGFVVTQLGRIPSVGDYLEWGGWRFEVVDMDGNRVDQVLVAPISTTQGNPGESSQE